MSQLRFSSLPLVCFIIYSPGSQDDQTGMCLLYFHDILGIIVCIFSVYLLTPVGNVCVLGMFHLIMKHGVVIQHLSVVTMWKTTDSWRPRASWCLRRKRETSVLRKTDSLSVCSLRKLPFFFTACSGSQIFNRCTHNVGVQLFLHGSGYFSTTAPWVSLCLRSIFAPFIRRRLWVSWNECDTIVRQRKTITSKREFFGFIWSLITEFQCFKKNVTSSFLLVTQIMQ